MKNSAITRPAEPMGIVISRGSRAEPASIFLAYVWGAAPDPADDPVEPSTA